MNRSIHPRLVLFVVGISLVFAGREARAENPDVALWDRVLAQVPAGAESMYLGDMRVPVATARMWRDQIASGEPAGFHTDSASQTGANKWTAGNVYYTFDPNVTIAAHKTEFRDAGAEWAMFANLHFIEGTGTGNYIVVSDGGTGLEGGAADLGMKGGIQMLSIGASSWNRGTLAHEIGHALGLIHEHQRSDQDTHVTILTANIISGQEGAFAKVPTSTNNGLYDFLSVMHYARNALSKNTLDTIEPQPNYAQYLNLMGNGQDRVLSRGDRNGIATMYGMGPELSAVVTNTKDSGAGSLRAALYYAFDFVTDHPGSPTTISFNIPTADTGFDGTVFTIPPTAQLPTPGPGTVIDGATQTTFSGNTNANGPEVVLRGLLVQPPAVQLPETFAPGLRLSEANCTVRGLVINNSSQQGVLITGAGATGNTISGCYIGTNAAGVTAVTNRIPGVTIEQGATGNTIGGTTAAARNVISGQTFQGILIKGAGTNGNLIVGNYLGLNAAGTGAVANGFAGVEIANGPQNNTVGGTAAGARNIISGNTAQGVSIHVANNNIVVGNTIGLNAAGTAAVGNGFAGVELWDGAQGNTIGGTVAGAGNVLSGNVNQGVLIDGAGTSGNVVAGNRVGVNAAGTAALGNQTAGVTLGSGTTGNIIGGTSVAARNVISGNTFQGFFLTDVGTTGNLVIGNYVGLNAAGTAALPNGFAGGEISGAATGNTIGGTAPGSGNVISGNHSQGVFLGGTGTMSNLVAGNFIGLNAVGTAAVQNGFSGVEIGGGATNNMIGGTTVAARNIISGNHGQGVALDAAGTMGNVVAGNFIGTNPAGTAALANGFSGVEIFNGAGPNTIGGGAPGAGNVISGNSDRGVLIDSGSTANTVAGNLIGLNASGLAAVPNLDRGVDIQGATENIIGSISGGRNYIAGNTSSGLVMEGPGTNTNLVQGNTIGLGVTGAAVPNTGEGIALFAYDDTNNGPQNNVIGGTTPGAANLISGNTFEGIYISNLHTVGNTISGNSIFGNGGLGINLIGGIENNGVTPNDNGDADTGPNNLQNYPVLSTAVLGTATTIAGTLNSTASTTFRVEFFASATADVSGFGEGQNFIGATNVTTNGSGNATINVALPAIIPAGVFISATATNTATGDTSEFSHNVAVTTTDTDGDGLPNAYETAHGLSTTVNDAALDSDGDGMSNLAEFRAGTDPKDPKSVLRAASPVLANGHAVLSLPSLPGLTYRVEYADDLAAASHWRPLADQIAGTGSTITITDPGAAALPKRFYRFLVLP